jgi:cell division protein FtsL
MGRMGYEYGTTPRKLEPNYRPSTTRKRDIQEQIKINERQRKEALKLERKKHNKNVALVIAIFLILLAISYRSSLINEKFNEIQTAKEKLASIEKTNGQLQVSIEGSLNLSNVEESAKEKLGMQKLDNGQKVFVTLDKKDYVEAGTEDINIAEETNDTWIQKIIKKIFNK